MTISPLILIVEATVDPSIESDWNRWYDDVHLPEIRECPGFRSGQRYRAEDAKSGRRYVAIYELDGPQALESAEFQARRGWGPFKGKVEFRTTMFHRITPKPSA